ncbi:MAG: tetratricopeptide repeat protein [Gemmatimonadales bacterium]
MSSAEPPPLPATSPAGRWAAAAILLLALAASLSSLGNGFAYDDQHIIAENPKVHSLAQPWQRFAEAYWPPEQGVSLYRPLTILGFALQWAAGGGRPFIYHAVNLLLYVASAGLLFAVARRLLPLGGAWIAAALWAVHPVHVEAVANGVGQSELLVAVLVLLAALLYLRGRERGRLTAGTEAGIAGCYLAACLVKEHAIMLPGLLGVLELWGVRDPRPLRQRSDDLRLFYLVLLLIAAAFLLVRTTVLGNLAGDRPPGWMAQVDTVHRWQTMLAMLPTIGGLLLWPAHLQAEYGPAEILPATGFGLEQFAGLMVMVGALVLAVASRRRQPVVTLGLALAALAFLPTSNLLLPTGIILSERTLLLPSVGICLALGAGWTLLPPRPLVKAVTAFVLLAGVAWSAWRQPVWKDNATLFRQMTIDAPFSFRAHWGYGSILYTTGDKPKGLYHLQVAARLYPGDPTMLEDVGGRLADAGGCKFAEPIFRQALAAVPPPTDAWSVRTRLIFCLMDLNRFDDAAAEAREGERQIVMVSQFRSLAKAADSMAAANRKAP